MKTVLTIDVEGHRSRQEISDSPMDGLAKILELFKRSSLQATFFVDFCEVQTWGREFMATVCQRISDHDHDVQLHAHPHHCSGDSNRWLLKEYSLDEQKKILDYAVSEYVHAMKRPPRAFRAGGFGANNDTIDLLRAHGVQIDSSFLYRHPNCGIRPASIDRPSHYRDMFEIPVTPVVTLGTRRHPFRVAPLDFNWLPLTVLQDSLQRLRRADAPYAILLMHSSSLFQRTSRSEMRYRPANAEKLQLLLEFLVREKFETTTFRSIDIEEEEAIKVPESMFVVNNPLNQYAILWYQSEIGKGFSNRIRLFRMTHFVFAFLSLVFLCWMFRAFWQAVGH